VCWWSGRKDVWPVKYSIPLSPRGSLLELLEEEDLREPVHPDSRGKTVVRWKLLQKKIDCAYKSKESLGASVAKRSSERIEGESWPP